MGFAKYHEDNNEIWEERNRDRRLPSVYANSSQLGSNNTIRNRIAEITAQGITRSQHNNTNYRVNPSRI